LGGAFIERDGNPHGFVVFRLQQQARRQVPGLRHVPDLHAAKGRGTKLKKDDFPVR
jgi:hypothetical protein